ncbi:hypothetical protein NP233_g8331 [Leucocoprinus birnbaumii]|uniref:Elongator complex protein 4 n=1 Tax=Leucocoprinus birnbaumii TaxID=56174 RepID=A0AAD5YTU8_9AGAR|nr:hypothetical protein NP233_g8331 [Leucocoprinus birnbaumii]
MSSFKRKGAAKTPTLPSYLGTRPSPASASTTITSTGIPSLDDILGGGLPLSCSMLILAPDLHSSYGSLVQKYFVAEGLACGHRVIVVDSDPEEFVRDIMWYPKGYTATDSLKDGGSGGGNGADSDDEEQTKGQDQKIKIAWRYEQMKQFQTSVKSSSLYTRTALYDRGSPSAFRGSLSPGKWEHPYQNLYTVVGFPILGKPFEPESHVLLIFSPVITAEASNSLCIYWLASAHLQRDLGWRRLASEARMA